MNSAFPTKSYSAIIFDCDGTLTDSMPWHYLAWTTALAPVGLQMSEDRFYALAGKPTQKIIELLAAEQQVIVDAVLVAEHKEQAFSSNLPKLQPIIPVKAVAEFFRGRIPMAVASGGYRSIIRRQLQQIQMEDLFEAVVTAEDTVRHKPEPDVFLKAAELLQVAPRDCLVYEDADLGIQAAAAAGMDAIDVRTFFQPTRWNR